MRALSLRLSLALFATVVAVTIAVDVATAPAAQRSSSDRVVLVLVDGLSWEAVEREPALREAFQAGGAATLSVVQGSRPPEDPSFGYVFLGAGARVDTRTLPERLPDEPAEVPDAFDGPAGTVDPGALGAALDRAGVEAAAVGDLATLVAMDRQGRVPIRYGGEDPAEDLRAALERGAGFVAVEAANSGQAAELVEVSRASGATTAVAAPNGPADSRNLSPFALVGPGVGGGLLYSPGTRTAGLISNADVAPTLLAALGVPAPPEMAGQAAEVRPGSLETAESLQRRIAFVAEEGFKVWLVVGGIWAAALAASIVWGGSRAAFRIVLALAGFPAGALLAAAVPVTSTLPVAVLTALVALAAAILAYRIARTFAGALVVLALATAVFVVLDAAAGGTLMRFSTLGYNPATGTRFYGLGNEYAAVLASGLAFSLGTLGFGRRPPMVLLAGLMGVVVLVVGLPTMGADVGGSLAVGLSLGATAGMVYGGIRSVALWTTGGLVFAAAVFLASGLLFPGVSHGSRAADGGSGLTEVLYRKLLMSLEYLTNPILLALLVVGAAVVFAGWRRVRGTALSVGMTGAVVAAGVSGALNDSGVIAVLFALIFPFVAAVGILFPKEPAD